MVVEHLQKPEDVFKEVYNVLKPNGIFVIHTTNILNYIFFMARIIPSNLKKRIAMLLDKRKEEDIFPTFYKVNTPKKIAKISRSANLTLIDMRMLEAVNISHRFLPLAFIDLLLMKITMIRAFRNFRSNVIAILRKFQ
jgi:2-polyprenyl-3-methyl-5-hydroxy-6-metoxy-1,4-benzoquinol methylase